MDFLKSFHYNFNNFLYLHKYLLYKNILSWLIIFEKNINLSPLEVLPDAPSVSTRAIPSSSELCPAAAAAAVWLKKYVKT